MTGKRAWCTGGVNGETNSKFKTSINHIAEFCINGVLEKAKEKERIFCTGGTAIQPNDLSDYKNKKRM